LVVGGFDPAASINHISANNGRMNMNQPSLESEEADEQLLIRSMTIGALSEELWLGNAHYHTKVIPLKERG